MVLKISNLQNGKFSRNFGLRENNSQMSESQRGEMLKIGGYKLKAEYGKSDYRLVEAIMTIGEQNGVTGYKGKAARMAKGDGRGKEVTTGGAGRDGYSTMVEA